MSGPESDTPRITIVSGLPRSGTSLMMNMLGAAGLPLLVDAHRPADDSNPRGYFEYEPVRASRTDVSWVPLAEGKVVKIIYALLDALPATHCYDVIYMRRCEADVVASQNAMLAKDGARGANLPVDRLVELNRSEADRVWAWIEAKSHMNGLSVQYEDVIANPLAAARSIASFLPAARLDEAAVAAMAARVDPSLHRQKQSD